MGDIHSFAQNYRPFSVSSGIEHGCGQFRESLDLPLKEIRLLPAGCPEDLFVLEVVIYQDMCLDLTLGCILGFFRWQCQAVNSGSLCPACF